LNPKQPDDGSVKGVSPFPKFFGICATISGHDLFASSINKNFGCPWPFTKSSAFQAFANLSLSSPLLVPPKASWQAAATGAGPATRPKGAAWVLAGGGERGFLYISFRSIFVSDDPFRVLRLN
jgi:hypothetical protein